MHFNTSIPAVAALQRVIGMPVPEPLTSIGAIGRQFAHEPGAPAGNWVPTYLPGTPRHVNPAHTYVVNRMAESAGVSKRQGQRYITQAMQERGASKPAMDKLRTAAEASRAQHGAAHLIPSPKANELARTGGVVKVTGEYRISEDPEYRDITPVEMPPELWKEFAAEWNAGNYQGAADEFSAAYSEAYGSNGYTYDIEWVSMEELTIV